MENITNNMIMEKAEKTGVKISGLDSVPLIIQGRPLFDFGDVDETILKNYGQDPDDLFMGKGLFNIALHPNGRVAGLKSVSKQYKVVQHNEAIWKLFDTLPEAFQLEKINIETTSDGGRCFAQFQSGISTEIKKGDKIQYRATMENSADTSKRYWLAGGAWRQICSNGMMAPDRRIERITSRKLHKGGLSLSAEVNAFLDNLEDSIESMSVWKTYAEKSLKAPDIETVFQQLEVGPRVQEELLNIPLRGGEGSVQTLLNQNQLTAWDLYNSFTQRITDSDTIESTKIANGNKVSHYFDKFLEAA